MSEKNNRFECLKETEKKSENLFKKGSNKSNEANRFHFKNESNNREKNTFKSKNRRYKDDFQYNSFNRKRKDSDRIEKEEPKKEFKINETDFPALG